MMGRPMTVPRAVAPASFLAAAPQRAAGTDSPRAFLERCLERIAALEPQIGAFVALAAEGARLAADRAGERWRAGRPLSPIDGMPFGVKDIIETADLPTEMGSPLFAGWRSGRDAASVAALREAGAVMLGKTVTTEFAASEPRGTRNPWDLERTPGGSSSGSAAAVACGMLPAALGTQVVGSIVRPASFCGVVGFKPSLGALNRGGSFDHLSQSCHGVIAASLAEAWVVARIVSARAGGDPGHPGLAGPAEPPPARPPRALALIETAGWAVAEPAARAALESALDRLRASGIAILTRRQRPELAALEAGLATAIDLTRRINAWEGRWPLNELRRRNAAQLSRIALDTLAQAEAMSREDYAALIAERARLRAQYAVLGGLCDAAVTLAAPGPAPLGLASTGNPVFAAPGSLLGVPAVSLPVLQADGLPLGLQLVGFAQEDAALVGLAAWIEGLFAERN